MAAKSAREKIRLVSSAGTGHFYTTTKNKKNTPDKMEIKKFDPKARKHVIYKETKLSKQQQLLLKTLIFDHLLIISTVLYGYGISIPLA